MLAPPEARLLQASVRLVESLLWSARARKVNPLILQITVAYEERFARQERFFFRRCFPRLREDQVLSEARFPKAAATDRTLGILDTFTDAVAAKTIDEAIGRALVLGAEGAANDTGFPIAFNLKSPAALSYLRQHAGEKLGRDVDKVTKKRVRRLIVQGFDEQWTFIRLKREIRGLYAGFRARAPQSFITNRAEVIAVTEVGEAYSAGSLSQAVELERRGVKLEKAWALAATPCPICAPNGAQGWIPIEKNFSSGHARPLAHPACRCSLLVRPKR